MTYVLYCPVWFRKPMTPRRRHLQVTSNHGLQIHGAFRGTPATRISTYHNSPLSHKTLCDLKTRPRACRCQENYIGLRGGGRKLVVCSSFFVELHLCMYVGWGLGAKHWTRMSQGAGSRQELPARPRRYQATRVRVSESEALCTRSSGAQYIDGGRRK